MNYKGQEEVKVLDFLWLEWIPPNPQSVPALLPPPAMMYFPAKRLDIADYFNKFLHHEAWTLRKRWMCKWRCTQWWRQREEGLCFSGSYLVIRCERRIESFGENQWENTLNDRKWTPKWLLKLWPAMGEHSVSYSHSWKRAAVAKCLTHLDSFKRVPSGRFTTFLQHIIVELTI